MFDLGWKKHDFNIDSALQPKELSAGSKEGGPPEDLSEKPLGRDILWDFEIGYWYWFDIG